MNLYMKCSSKIAKEIGNWLYGKNISYFKIPEVKKDFRSLLVFLGFPYNYDIEIYDKKDEEFFCTFKENSTLFSFSLFDDSICIKNKEELFYKRDKNDFFLVSKKCVYPTFTYFEEFINGVHKIQVKKDSKSIHIELLYRVYHFPDDTVISYVKRLIISLLESEDVFKLSIIEIYKKICELFKHFSLIHPIYSLTISFKLEKEDNASIITDFISYDHGEIKEIKVSNNGKTIDFICPEKWIYIRRLRKGTIKVIRTSNEEKFYLCNKETSFPKDFMFIQEEVDEILKLQKSLPLFHEN